MISLSRGLPGKHPTHPTRMGQTIDNIKQNAASDQKRHPTRVGRPSNARRITKNIRRGVLFSYIMRLRSMRRMRRMFLEKATRE
jgi:hypothetical protein